MSGRTLGDPRWLVETPQAAALRQAAGAVAVHWVGGTVRDALLGLRPTDFDAVVERDGERIARELARLTGGHLVRIGKREFATYRVVGSAATDGIRFDLWDRRGKPLVVDLLRRDFTINAVAVDLANGLLLDPLGGRRDLASGRLRQVSSTGLESDPLRALRLVRFAGGFDFTVEPRTLSSARRAAAHLAEVAAERAREEWRLVLALPRLGRALPVLGALGILGPHPGASRTLERLARLEATNANLAPRHRRHLALSRWCLIARGLGRTEFQRLFEDTRWIARDLGCRVSRLAATAPPGPEEADRREWIHHLGDDWEGFAWALAAEGGGGSAQANRLMRDLYAQHENLRSRLRSGFFVDGSDLLRCGLRPGRQLGAALFELRRLQVRGELNDRGEALERARQLSAEVTSATPSAD